MDSIELPYKAEYAKSNRASCKGCKTTIGKDSLRIAVMVQSAFHDGKQPNWFHESCFFKKARPATAGDIENFENLRYEDQERVKKQIAEVGSGAVVVAAAGGKGKKRSKGEAAALKDFGIEYAKSGRAACRGCEQKILKDQVRIRKTVFDTEVGMKYGGQPLWHHVECFAQVRGELGWLAAGDNLPGFKSLSKDDQSTVKEALPALKAEDIPEVKKAKLEKKDEKEIEEEQKLAEKIKSQTKRLFKFRDSIKQEMKKFDIVDILELNGQLPVEGDSEKLYDQVADMLAFGALDECTVCHGRQMLFHKSGYLCNGALTEWTKCANLEKEPKRKPVKLTSEHKSNYPFLKDVKKKIEVRAIQYIAPSSATIAKNVAMKKEDEIDGPKVKRERPPLYLFQFALIGLKDMEADLKKRITKLGGKVTSVINDKTIAVLSTKEEVEKSGRMAKARFMGIHVVPVDYIKCVEDDPSGAVRFISSLSICDWGTDPSARLPQEEIKSSKSKSIYTKSVPTSMKVKIKDGMAVDPDSGLEDVAHVYVDGKTKYNVVLGLTDIQRNKNSYYKLQLLESDTKNRHWVFRSWGRIGTTIGGSKVDDYKTLYEAVSKFKDAYLDKTGNSFEDRDHFVKVPGKMYPIDVSFAEDIPVKFDTQNCPESKLEKPVQDLVKLIFDVDAMKRTMLEFEIDMEKMPLGKLSKKQLQSAYAVLTEIQQLIQNSGNNSQFIDATNRFYTLIPHNFGVKTPPLLDTMKQVEDLCTMLDNLVEIECAYNLIKTEDTENDVNPIDKHYEQLKTAIEPLDRQGKEFAMIKKYVKNTHAETHKMYELEVVDVFKVVRQGEVRRYKPFKKLHNRRLLWHGSRLTNFVGILSHGLKIAPPEAPATGYMFGKGIYFADMVSKSANYCCTNPHNSTGLMLLSEVALGDMMEFTQANYVTKLPKDKHSTFGKGRTMPDPAQSHIREDGVEIPLGKAKTDSKLASSLLYNEFIVYDIAQVNIQYLLRMNFKYNY